MKMGNRTAEVDQPMLQMLLSDIYNQFEGSQEMTEYRDRHNINSAAVLTVIDDETAAALVEHLKPRIEGKTVVEIGGGIGLLSLHIARVAKRVYCFEANPLWSWTFAKVLLSQKPKNVSFIFGAADEFVGSIKADVAVLATHSDIAGMRLVGQQFAPTVIDVYGEIIDAKPEAFDPFARQARYYA
ncbi:hypothetical protein [Bradyrhizobium sp. BRP56]|uniref:hypothetical protein n=1 Tax=Bradyrhizobium sp. BRP56 TaxID=2793819 RepID=UPI001CD2A52F|nr:hypothetical protein [Bradyrhizobium sp. BRP56]MCA1398665.1 hypothetical protein [Bradyrhizobium sp. BRP56]